MSYLSEAHSEWHLVNGQNACCPLDCGASEVYHDPTEYMTDEELAEYDAYVSSIPEATFDDPWILEDDIYPEPPF